METMVLHQHHKQQRGSGLFGASGASTTTRPKTKTMMKKQQQQEEDEEREREQEELRRGPWTVDEDLILINYIADHGEGRWNALARAAGLKRTGKSCRLRWLNYLRPDVKRGDFTADEQLLILDLHSRWGNRWSKIAQQLPGRTDNEIKNYWRTRVQKHARQLGCDVNSRRFKDAMTFLWMPRLAERASAGAAASSSSSLSSQSQRQGQGQGQLLVGTNTSSTPAVDTAAAACVMVPSSSSSSSDSSSSLTTTTDQSTSIQEEEDKTLLHLPCSNAGTSSSVDCWTTGAAEADHHYLWSLQQELNDLQDLTGWVQGFSEGGIISSSSDHAAADDHISSLWSLDDLWRMQ